MRHLALIAGILLLAVIWFGPLLNEWRESFASHMLAHMGVIAVAAPLIALGLPVKWRPGPSMPVALPVIASVLELFTVWAWHAPMLRAASKASLAMTAFEQVSFLAVGVLLWWSSFGAPGSRSHAAAGAIALLLTSIHMTLLGALLALSPRSLYGSENVTCFGLILDAGEDQQFGGVIMLLVGAIIYLTGGVFLISRLLSDRPATITNSHLAQ
jgi:putative membrane protein